MRPAAQRMTSRPARRSQGLPSVALFFPASCARVKNKTKVVGTVGTRQQNTPESLMYQGIELYPLHQIFGGYKVGTVGTTDALPTHEDALSPPVPTTFSRSGYNENPMMARVCGVLYPCTHCTHHFFYIYRANSRSRSHFCRNRGLPCFLAVLPLCPPTKSGPRPK